MQEGVLRYLCYGIVGLAWFSAACGDPAKKVYTVADEPPRAEAPPPVAEPWIEAAGSLTTTKRRVHDTPGLIRFVRGPGGLPPGEAAGAGDLNGDGAPDWWTNVNESAILVVGGREAERRVGWRVRGLEYDVDGDERDDVIFVQPGHTLAQTPARDEPVAPDARVLPDLDRDGRFEIAWAAGGAVWISQANEVRSISAYGDVLWGARIGAAPEVWLLGAGALYRYSGAGEGRGDVTLGAEELIGLADPAATGQTALLLRGAVGLTIAGVDGARLAGAAEALGALAPSRDFDGDGVRDFLSTACTGPGQGGLVAVSGRTGQVIGRVDGCPAWVASAGDYDGDGLDDLWMSSPTETTIWLSRRSDQNPP